MTKHFVAACFFALAGATASAQTLFTYGNDSVSVQAFITAYRKNNTGNNSPAALQEYLQLYIASRLKIKEAKERGYDALPHLQTEISNLREQIMPAYLKDEEKFEQLAKEALTRAQKDLELSHIFIALAQDGLRDSAAAAQKGDKAFKQLQQGKSFAAIARQYSDDPSVEINGGKVGFITAFTLPYELENLAYATPVGSFSKPHLSKRGYHILKVDSERPARGRIRAAQILLAFPPDADAATDALLKKRIDSLYTQLQKGADFGKLAAQFSNDPISAQADGQLPEISIGQYDAQFENILFSLLQDGAYSQPFKTAHGYHIVKRLALVPVTSDEAGLQWARGKVEGSEDRMATMQTSIAQKVLQTAPYKQQPFHQAELWAYSDSVLEGKRENKSFTLTPTTPLFTLGESSITVNDWIQFAQVARYKSDGSGIEPYPTVWNAFVQSQALEHYKQNLEGYNAAFRNQLEEFKEGSLFFEIMQQEVWNKSQADTAALQQFYNQHKAKYQWQKSADAILFYANDSAAAKALQAAIAKAPRAWRNLAAQQGAVADSGRFELQQLPGTAKGVLKSGSLTQPVKTETDNSYAFAYVVKLYSQPAQRTFAEARSLVTTDYQAQLEKDWVESLQKKYNVQVKKEALQQLLGTTNANSHF